MKGRFFILIGLFFFSANVLQAQTVNDAIRQLLSEEKALEKLRLKKPALVKAYYASQNFTSSFFDADGKVIRDQLLEQIMNADSLGLNVGDYQQALVSALKNGTATQNDYSDTADAEIRLTDAALHLLSDVHGGNDVPAFRYQGISYKPSEETVIAGWKKAFATKHFWKAIGEASPNQLEYQNAMAMLRRLQASSVQEKVGNPVLNTAALATNETLLAKLQAYGFLNADEKPTEAVTQKALRSAQQLFDLAPDGKLTKATLEALNISPNARIKELRDLLNTLRWLNNLREDSSVAIVNIPSATLMIYQKGELVLHSKLIVGKPSTPTPTLSSAISEVILYPYWNVPHSIALKELLPAIKRSHHYLEQNNFQVLNKAGAVVNPATIHWHSLSASYFPYTIRQSTGCDNSLGIIKFNFYNPFTVYLHDTPAKSLFNSSRRFFSHGCMRVEKPIELARLLLQKDSATVDAMTKQCLRDQKPVVFTLPQSVPVVVLYQTAWFSEDGSIRLFSDVYRRRPGTTASLAKAD